METLPCRVLEPLRHDGVDYPPEGVVTLGPATAAGLIAAGVLAPLPARGPGAASRRAPRRQD